jgi:Zn-dependent protease with chaperone function
VTPRRWEWSGFYYDGRTAARESVTLTLEGNRLRIRRADGTTMLWPLSLVRQTQGGYSTEQVRLEFGDEPAEALLVNDPTFAAEIREASPVARRAVRRQWKTAHIVGLSAVALVIVVGLYVWAAPAGAVWAADRMPKSWEVSMGRSFVEHLERYDRVCANADSVPELRAIVTRLTDAGPGEKYRFHVIVVRDSSINAFAAPGGFVFLFSGLVNAAKTPEELAGVLAHEIQHVTLRHSTRSLLREVPLRFALFSVTGSGEATANTVASLGALTFRRSDETEADREGMRLLQAAGVDPSGMVSFMRTLHAEHGDAPRFVRYLSSHPRTADRIAELERLASKARYETRPLLDDAAWGRLRGLCEG